MSYDSQLAAFSPVAWWKLADALSSTTAADSSGNGFTGTVTGTTFGQTGPAGMGSETCALFNAAGGVGDYITASPSAISAPYTVLFWCNLDNTVQTVPFSSRAPSDHGFDVQTKTTLIHGDVGDGTAWVNTTVDYSGTVTQNAWHMVAYVVTATGATIYLDGSSVATPSWSSAAPLLFDATHTAFLAGRHGTDQCFSGYLAQIACFSAGLTAPNISSLWTAGSTAPPSGASETAAWAGAPPIALCT